MSSETFGKRTYALRQFPVRGHGLMLEVLPYVFVNENDFYLSITQPSVEAKLVFIRNPLVGEGYHEELSDLRIEEATFLAAVDLLEDSIGHGPHVWLHRRDLFDEMLNLPSLISHAVHLFQVDKLGVPYIEHPRTVARNAEIGLSQNLEVLSNGDIDAGIAAAWLHDALEDSEKFFYRQISEDDLLNWGINERTTHIVKLLTRSEQVPEDVYYSRILTDSVARTVKLADIAHNTNSARARGLEPEQQEQLASKYQKALRSLGYHMQVDTWFQPLADLLDNLGLPFTDEIASEAFGSALSNLELPNRYRAGARLPHFDQLPEIAIQMQKRDTFSPADQDAHIVLGLFWQFYIMLYEHPFSYNPALVAEFYSRKQLVENSEHSEFLYPLREMSIPEIIKRAERAKANLAKYNKDHYETNDFGESHWTHIWPDSEELSRDAAAELLLVAFAEFMHSSEARDPVKEIKVFISNCLPRISAPR